MKEFKEYLEAVKTKMFKINEKKLEQYRLELLIQLKLITKTYKENEFNDLVESMGDLADDFKYQEALQNNKEIIKKQFNDLKVLYYSDSGITPNTKVYFNKLLNTDFSNKVIYEYNDNVFVIIFCFSEKVDKFCKYKGKDLIRLIKESDFKKFIKDELL
jgi:UDP:flavonoid glycosyltransferase YjiC (YdhE family)